MKRKYEKRDLYKEVTQRFVDALKNGAPPWIKPWSDSAGAGRPTNAATNRKYSGINISILWSAATAAGYTSDRWLTYNQVSAVGGHVCRGQKSTVAILYRDCDVKRKDATGAAVLDENGRPMIDTIKLIKGFPLFNVAQCDGLPTETIEGSVHPHSQPAWNPHQAADACLESRNVKIQVRGTNAFYKPREDIIQMPHKTAFNDGEAYYSTLLHEATHWTGHKSRLARPGITAEKTPDEVYAFEELIAEIGSAFLCAEFGIRGDLRHEGYVLSWIRGLENDSKAIFKASSLAWKARCYLLDEEV